MIAWREIIAYLAEHATDPVPNFIMQKEILREAPESPACRNAYSRMTASKWYKELADDQLADGSWGAFHGGSTKAQRGHRFGGTEPALRRARELGLTKDDPIVAGSIGIMEKYARGEAPYPDRIESHRDKGKGHLYTVPYAVAANINMFDPENPMIQPLRDEVVKVLQEAFAGGGFDEETYARAIREYRVAGITMPGNAFSAMLLQNSDCMDDALQRRYLQYVWHKRDGIMYISNYPLIAQRDREADCHQVEALQKSVDDKGFYTWLAIFECLGGFSLFHEQMRPNVLPHLLLETDRLLNGDVALPALPGGHGTTCSHYVYGRYSESWRDKNNQKTDMVLRIARILAKCFHEGGGSRGA